MFSCPVCTHVHHEHFDRCAMCSSDPLEFDAMIMLFIIAQDCGLNVEQLITVLESKIQVWIDKHITPNEKKRSNCKCKDCKCENEKKDTKKEEEKTQAQGSCNSFIIYQKNCRKPVILGGPKESIFLS